MEFVRVHRGVSARIVSAVLGACLATSLAGCATQQSKAVPDVPQAVPYRIGPSDELVIRVLPDPPIEREVIVQPDGEFAFDLIGEVDAAGKTPAEVAADIEGRIAEYRVSPN